MWIKPHFELLSKLDHNLVLIHKRPLPNYHIEHGYKTAPDLSEKLIRQYFPNVEIVYSNYPEGKEFGAELYNEGLRLLEDYDSVFRLDPDMFFLPEVWDQMIQYVRNTNFDCYRMDFKHDSINYYMTNDFDHGLKDAQEIDPLAVNPKIKFTDPLEYPMDNHTFFTFPDFFCHHFRGWNKPKSTPKTWYMRPNAYEALEAYGNKGEWYKCPQEIRDQLEPWLKELQEIKIQNGLQT